MNQLNNEREAMLVPGAIIECGSRNESCTDPTEDRYQVCGIARDHKGEYVVVYQELFDERETLTCPIQEFLGGIGETKTIFGKAFVVPKFKLCKEMVEVSQNVINSGIKDPSTAELLEEIASLRKELKHMSRDLKKLQKLTAPLKKIKTTKAKVPDVQPAPMPTIPYPVMPASPITPEITCAVTPTDVMKDAKNKAIESLTVKAPDMVEQAAKAFDMASKPTAQKGHKIRMIEEDK